MKEHQNNCKNHSPAAGTLFGQLFGHTGLEMVVGVVGGNAAAAGGLAGINRNRLMRSNSRKHPSVASLTRQNSEMSGSEISHDSLQVPKARSGARRLSRVGSQMGYFQPLEALQEPLPAQEHWIHSGKLRKRVVAQDVSWQVSSESFAPDTLLP